MKNWIHTLAFSLALFAVAEASAQRWSAGSRTAADSVLLSESTDGDYLVRRYLIRNDGDAGYTVRYQINMAQLAPDLHNNTHQLDRLGSFVDQLMRDTLMHVRSVTVTGYSSPDGPVAFNEQLANKRASDFKRYLDGKYAFSRRYDVALRAVAEDWEMCRMLVAQSDIPNKQAVLDIIDSSRAVEAKEQALKQLPSAWNYMKTNILPPLRRVELAIDYGDGNVVEVRTRIPRPEPQPAPQPECCCCVVIDDETTGILVELPVVGRDFGEYERAMRREVRDLERFYGKERREAEQWNRKRGRFDRKAKRDAGRSYDRRGRDRR